MEKVDLRPGGGDSLSIHLLSRYGYLSCLRMQPYEFVRSALPVDAPVDSMGMRRLCLCSHTTHSAAAAPSSACFRFLGPLVLRQRRVSCVFDG